MWLGPQFQINNWQAYGFAQPAAGQRWVRYYDDAYLIDANGRVVDTRYGSRLGSAWRALVDAERHSPLSRDAASSIPTSAIMPGSSNMAGQAGYAPAGYGYSGNSQGCGGYTYGYGCGGYGGYGVAYPIIIETTTMAAAAAPPAAHRPAARKWSRKWSRRYATFRAAPSAALRRRAPSAARRRLARARPPANAASSFSSLHAGRGRGQPM